MAGSTQPVDCDATAAIAAANATAEVIDARDAALVRALAAE